MASWCAFGKSIGVGNDGISVDIFQTHSHIATHSFLATDYTNFHRLGPLSINGFFKGIYKKIP